jgi:hypothetical protein
MKKKFFGQLKKWNKIINYENELIIMDISIFNDIIILKI